MLQNLACYPCSAISATTHFQYNKLDLSNIIRVNPVFSSLSNETGLATSCRTVALHGMSSGSDYIVKLRQFNDV